MDEYTNISDYLTAWSKLALRKRSPADKDNMLRITGKFVMADLYLLNHPVLAPAEKVLLLTMLSKLTIDVVRDPEVLTVTVPLTVSDLAYYMNESRSQTSRDLDRLAAFGLVRKVGKGNGRNVAIELVVKGPWPLLGDSYTDTHGWRNGFLFRLGKESANKSAKMWRKAVINGHVTDVHTQLPLFLQSGGKTVDPDIEDMRPLFNKKARPKTTKDSQRDVPTNGTTMPLLSGTPLGYEV